MYNNKKTIGRILKNEDEAAYSYSSYDKTNSSQKSPSLNNAYPLQINSSPPRLSPPNSYFAERVFSPSSNDVEDEFQDETLYFERNRIQHLKDERIYIQKKTFTKWCNSYLNKVN